MIKKFLTCFCFILFASIVTSAYAEPQEKQNTIPKVDDLNPGYLSTIYLINPCYKGDDDFPEESKEASLSAQKDYPPHACDNAVLSDKIYKASFLQNVLLTMVSDPWNLDNEVDKQNNEIKNCNDLTCLEKTLNRIIDELSPLYFSNLSKVNKQQPFCLSEIDYSQNKDLKKQVDIIIKERTKKIKNTDTCFEAGKVADVNNPEYDDNENLIPHQDINFQVCKTNIGIVFSGYCQMAGNQVNTQNWINLLEPTKPSQSKKQLSMGKEIFYDEQGPFYTSDKNCNNMPILITSERYNMGEHLITYYLYDGDKYQMVYSYTQMYIGDDSNDNQLAIATDVTKADTPVHCREEK